MDGGGGLVVRRGKEKESGKGKGRRILRVKMFKYLKFNEICLSRYYLTKINNDRWLLGIRKKT